MRCTEGKDRCSDQGTHLIQGMHCYGLDIQQEPHRLESRLASRRPELNFLHFGEHEIRLRAVAFG